MSLISLETIKAYRETNFNVFTSIPFTLKVDSFSSELLALYAFNSSNNCVFITACNPFSEVVSDEKNAHLQSNFEKYLKDAKLSYVIGEGKHPSGDWEGESSFLVFGLGIDESKRLGIELKQNAIVWCDSDAVPKLILLR
jgi:hypothetical protein